MGTESAALSGDAQDPSGPRRRRSVRWRIPAQLVIPGTGMSLSWAELFRRFVTGIDSRGPQAGWATSTLYLSLRNALLVGIIAIQGLIVVSAIIDAEGASRLVPLVVAPATLAIVAWLVLVDRCPPWVVVYGTYAVAVTAAALSSSPDNVLTFNSLWLTHLGSGLPAAMIRKWPAFVAQLIGCVGYSVGVAVVHADWGPTIPQGQIVAGLGIMLAIRASLALLAGVTARADARAATAAAEVEHLAWVRKVSTETSEQARILHDTVINTLAAIASGGGAIRNARLIRERCASDQQTVDEILDGRQDPDSVDEPFASLRQTGITIVRSGLDNDQLRGAFHTLPANASEDIERAVFEIVQNVTKHAGVRVASLDTRVQDGRLVVTVTDEGVGFDPSQERLRGLAGSVFGRAERSGIEVELSSRPGDGTTVILRAPEPTTSNDAHILDDPDTDNRLETVVAATRGGATWLWAVCVLLVGIVLEVATQPGRWTPTYLALGIGFLAVVLAWLGRERSEPTKKLLWCVLIVLASVGFVLSAATSDFGRDDPALWQLLTMTGVIVLLWADSKTAGLVAVGMQVATAIVIAALLWPTSSTAALIVLSGVIVPILFVLIWARFEGALGRIGQQLAENRWRILTARVASRQREAADASRHRWQNAGLVRIRDILHGLADGSLDASDDAVRRACGNEESYLRQLIQLSPEMVRLGSWLVQALDNAHERGVDLRIRSGELEPATEESADEIGRMLLEVVHLTNPGETLTITIFGVSSDELVVTVVGPRGLLADSGVVGLVPSSTRYDLTTVGTQGLFEVRVPV